MRMVPLLVALLASLPACAVFDGPPDVTLDGAKEGLLSDAKAPVVLDFSKAPELATVRVEIAPYVVNMLGQLADEDDDPNTTLMPLFAHDPVNGDTGGTSAFSADHRQLTITPAVPLPFGAQLVVLIEPGLADEAGVVTRVRRRIVFGYASKLDCNAPAAVLASGTYFVLVEVTAPIHVQIKLWGALDLDPTTGAIRGQFTDAKRNPDPNRCPMPCDATDVCRLLPMPACVAPSEPAGTVDEFPDYVPNPDAPTGFSFAAPGCSVDQGPTTASFATSPVDVEVQSPHVTLRNTGMTASFALGSDTVLRGTGTLSADAVLLGTINSGAGQGDLTARSVPADQAPPGLPQP